MKIIFDRLGLAFQQGWPYNLHLELCFFLSMPKSNKELNKNTVTLCKNKEIPRSIHLYHSSTGVLPCV
jgi:hypothetical protein